MHAQIGVVVILDVRRQSVEQSRPRRGQSFRATENPGITALAQIRGGGHDRVGRRDARSAHRQADDVGGGPSCRRTRADSGTSAQRSPETKVAICAVRLVAHTRFAFRQGREPLASASCLGHFPGCLNDVLLATGHGAFNQPQHLLIEPVVRQWRLQTAAGVRDVLDHGGPVGKPHFQPGAVAGDVRVGRQDHPRAHRGDHGR